MTRIHTDDVDVQRGQVGEVEGPARFVWDGRFYVVLTVLDQWVEAGSWWPQAGRAGTRPAGAAVDDGELELWRVEAAAGRSSPPGVFDLSFDWSTGRWSLIRVHD